MDLEVKISLTVNITPDDLACILSTAFEGGINYWCGRYDVKTEPPNWNEIVPPHPKYLSPAAGGVITLTPIDKDDADFIADLDLEKLLKGIALAAEKNRIPGFSPDPGDWDIDANAADSIIQFALWGEEVFA